MTHVVVAIIKNRAEQVLIQQRPKGKPSAGLWEFPGGKVESNESPIQALVRELVEELDLRFSINDFQHFMHYPQEDLSLDFYLTTAVPKTKPQGIEGQQWRWVSLQELSLYQFLEPNYTVIEALQSSQ